MPAFIKTEKDEAVWKRAKAVAHKQYGEKEDPEFWAIVNHVYHKMRGKKASAPLCCRLDYMADTLQAHGLHELALSVDAVANSLEA